MSPPPLPAKPLEQQSYEDQVEYYGKNSHQLKLDSESIIEIDLEDPIRTMRALPSYINRWSMLLAVAEYKVATLKHTRDYGHWASAAKRIRTTLEAIGSRVTEKRMDEELAEDPGYTSACKNVIISELIRDKIQAVVSALYNKEKMVQSINSRQKSELS